MNKRMEYWNNGILEYRVVRPSCAPHSLIPPFHHSLCRPVGRQRGIALLMVLLLVVAITILATGFLAGTDTELASGANTLLRVQMDQLAESGLEQGRGLVLHPQDVNSLDATAQQLTPRSADYPHDDYYDVHVSQDTSRPFDNCTYDLKCEAYRKLVTGSTTNIVGWSGLEATLRLDPCIALAVGATTTLWQGVMVHGDVYAQNTLTSYGYIYGDVLAPGLTGTGTKTGQLLSPTLLPASWSWPPVTDKYSNPQYDPVVPWGGAYGPHHIVSCTGNLDINAQVTIYGMLSVKGNLTIDGNASASQIMADKNLPALYVSGNLTIQDVNNVQIDGLVVVDKNMSVTNSSLIVMGGLFVKGTLGGSAATVTVTADPMKAAVVAWNFNPPQYWSPAAGAFYKKIWRQQRP